MGVHEIPNHRIKVQVLQVMTSFGPLNRDRFRAYLSDLHLGNKGSRLEEAATFTIKILHSCYGNGDLFNALAKNDLLKKLGACNACLWANYSDLFRRLVTPNCGLSRESLANPLNSDLGIIVFCLDVSTRMSIWQMRSFFVNIEIVWWLESHRKCVMYVAENYWFPKLMFENVKDVGQC